MIWYPVRINSPGQQHGHLHSTSSLTTSHSCTASYVVLQTRRPQGRGLWCFLYCSFLWLPLIHQCPGQAQVSIPLGPSEWPWANSYCHMALLILTPANDPYNPLLPHFWSLWLLPPHCCCINQHKAVPYDFLISLAPPSPSNQNQTMPGTWLIPSPSLWTLRLRDKGDRELGQGKQPGRGGPKKAVIQKAM